MQGVGRTLPPGDKPEDNTHKVSSRGLKRVTDKDSPAQGAPELLDISATRQRGFYAGLPTLSLEGSPVKEMAFLPPRVKGIS